MYGADNNLVSNSISRYKVGTYSTNLLAMNADGTLTIYIQNASPPTDKVSNWLPAPAGGFHLVMRCYLPRIGHRESDLGAAANPEGSGASRPNVCGSRP